MTVSEVARIRQRIADEYQAATWGLSGLAYGTSQHRFITAKMENMGDSFAELTELVGSPEKAIEMVNETLEALPETPKRFHIVDFLRRALENTEETTLLIEHIEEMWVTIDVLRARFGPERARKIIDTSSSFISESEPRAV
jgi:hypothetical protein